MAKKRLWLAVFLSAFAGLLAACGGKEDEPQARPADPVRLVSARQLDDGRHEYVLWFGRSGVSGSTDQPACFGDYNGWAWDNSVESDLQGNLLATVTTFNRESKISLVGDIRDLNWFDATTSSYNDNGTIVIGFADGKIYRKGKMPTRPLPGDTGDNVIRWRVSGDSLSIWLNLSRQAGGRYDNAFFMSELDNWQTHALAPSDAYGWAEGGLTGIVAPTIVRLTGGGHWSPDPIFADWIDIRQSDFFDPERDCLSIAIP